MRDRGKSFQAVGEQAQAVKNITVDDKIALYLFPPTAMQLTRYTDYSFRVLIYLAVKTDSLSTITEIAEAYDISRNHLVKVVHELGLHGFIKTYRGKNGGIQLGQPPEAIVLGDVVRQMEVNLEVVDCTGPETCCILPACSLHGILRQARDAFLAVLDDHTLADLINQRDKRLLKILSPSGPRGK